MKRVYIALAASALLFNTVVFAQEALKSAEENYYDFLSLQGLVKRPSLNYRTLSDSVWNVSPSTEHAWQLNNLGTTYTLLDTSDSMQNAFLDGSVNGIKARLYGPQWYNSYNTAAPYGMNDGALWQGKGYNTSLTAGARLEAYGLELTLKPQFVFSQNLDFEIMKSHSDSEYGYFWGYGTKNNGVDLPQRFGDEAFYYFDWGDTEVRYTWKNLTLGFGTQAIWLGPAQVNAILHSNNAPTYPKFDAGLRRTEIHIPWLNWYIGDIEARIWTGKLTESDYYDSDESNDNNMIHGLALAYAPSFVPGLTLFANRTCLVKWDWENLKYIIPVEANTHVGEQGAGEDLKMSFGADWIFAPVGLEIYGELGLDDFVPNSFPIGYIRYPLHTLVYTLGLKKTFTHSEEKKIYGEFTMEINSTEMSQDFQLQWPYNFGFHHQITQGYTNRGQYLANATGYGGNLQYISYSVLYPKGKTKLTVARWNPDNNYIYSVAVNSVASDKKNNIDLNKTHFTSWKANFILGLESEYFVTPNLLVNAGALYNLIINPQYQNDSTKLHNFHFELGIKYNF